MWDERYSQEGYAYGTQANDFLKEVAHHIPKGRVLCIAEGEGRNAVYLAQMGYAVTAVDLSAVGLHKAQALAKANGVSIETVQADLSTYDFGVEQWAGVVSIFCPLPSAIRPSIHHQIAQSLQPGGVFVLEAYRPEQLNYGTGGGKSADTMVQPEEIQHDLEGLQFKHLKTLEREVLEGQYHTGLGAVVQAVAFKAQLSDAEFDTLRATFKVGAYRHYKGGEYEVLGLARQEHTGQPLVVYKALRNNTLWTRPIDNFTAWVDTPQGRMRRFTPA